jgi:hypothetical protein
MKKRAAKMQRDVQNSDYMQEQYAKYKERLDELIPKLYLSKGHFYNKDKYPNAITRDEAKEVEKIWKHMHYVGVKGMPMTIEQLLQAYLLVSGGNFTSTAVESLGLNSDVVFNFLKKANTEKEKIDKYNPAVIYQEILNQADAKAEMYHVANIAKHAQTNWNASAWYLERKHFEKWGRKDKAHISGNLTVDVSVQGEPEE